MSSQADKICAIKLITACETEKEMSAPLQGDEMWAIVSKDILLRRKKMKAKMNLSTQTAVLFIFFDAMHFYCCFFSHAC